MSFGDVSTAAGLEKLNAFLLDNSYAGGWVPTQVDVALFNAIKSSPDGMLSTVGKTACLTRKNKLVLFLRHFENFNV